MLSERKAGEGWFGQVGFSFEERVSNLHYLSEHSRRNLHLFGELYVPFEVHSSATQVWLDPYNAPRFARVFHTMIEGGPYRFALLICVLVANTADTRAATDPRAEKEALMSIGTFRSIRLLRSEGYDAHQHQRCGLVTTSTSVHSEPCNGPLRKIEGSGCCPTTPGTCPCWPS